MRALTICAGVVIGLGGLGAAYYWGYWCGRQEADAAIYDRLLLDLSNSILVGDAMRAGKSEIGIPVVQSKLETDFFRMVRLYEENKFDAAATVRCAVSRRFRKMKEAGQIASDENAMREAGMPPEVLNTYLQNECPGNPSHDNWAATTK